MASKDRSTRDAQKVYWGNKLNCYMKVLADKGLESEKIDKDPIVRKMRAKIRKTRFRLRVITENEKKVEEMARIKEEKKTAPPKEKAKKVKPSKQAPAEDKPKKKKKKEVKKEKPEKVENKKPDKQEIKETGKAKEKNSEKEEEKRE